MLMKTHPGIYTKQEKTKNKFWKCAFVHANDLLNTFINLGSLIVFILLPKFIIYVHFFSKKIQNIIFYGMSLKNCRANSLQKFLM